MIRCTKKICAWELFFLPGPTSQDAETPSYYGLNPFCYIVNAGGGTRSDSEFRRSEMWALEKIIQYSSNPLIQYSRGPLCYILSFSVYHSNCELVMNLTNLMI
jgi:hypothetical protein